MKGLKNGDIRIEEQPRKMNKKRRGERVRAKTRKAPCGRVHGWARKEGQRDKAKAARVLPREKTWKVKRPPTEIVEDRENIDVDDLTGPSIHKNIVAPPCNFHERMYERDDWRDNFENV